MKIQPKYSTNTGVPGRRRGPALSAAATAAAHLRAADPVLARLLDEHGPPELRRDPSRPAPGDHYGALLRAIVGQQLSVIAARAIYGRVLERYRRPHAVAARSCSPTTPTRCAPRPACRARRSPSCARWPSTSSRASSSSTGSRSSDDDEVLAELTAVKGIGAWSAHMFLMFQLERPDVLASGDLGIRRAVERAYGLPALPSPADVEALAERWRPHRSAACRLLWRSLDNAPG